MAATNTEATYRKITYTTNARALLVRWILYLQEYQLDFEHKSIESMGHDGVSRAGFSPPGEKSECYDHQPEPDKNTVVGTIGIPGYDSHDISSA